MKKIINYIIISVTLINIYSCSDDDNLNREQSVLDTSVPELTELDIYIRDSITLPYNIEVLYKWKESEFDLERYLYPPDLESVKPCVNAVKKIWIDSYNRAGGDDFVKRIAPRQLALAGGYNSNPTGTVTLGYAEAGKKIVLFNLDYINYESKESVQEFLHTIQHEYTHILNQTEPFDNQTYGEITPTDYTVSWESTTDSEALRLGFVSAYSRSSITEDVAEMVSEMLSMTNEEWEDYLENTIPNEDAREKIRAKEAIIVSYFNNSLNIDFYELQAIVAEHTEEVIN